MGDGIRAYDWRNKFSKILLVRHQNACYDRQTGRLLSPPQTSRPLISKSRPYSQALYVVRRSYPWFSSPNSRVTDVVEITTRLPSPIVDFVVVSLGISRQRCHSLFPFLLSELAQTQKPENPVAGHSNNSLPPLVLMSQP